MSLKIPGLLLMPFCLTSLPIILAMPTPREGANSPSSGAPAAT